MSDDKQLPGEVLTQTPQMSLRDHFAGLALQALISKKPMVQNREKDGYGEPVGSEKVKEVYETMAYSAYSYADAMLRARLK